MLYAVGKGVSLSFIEKECNFGVMHCKQYAENRLFREINTIYFLTDVVPESPKETII